LTPIQARELEGLEPAYTKDDGTQVLGSDHSFNGNPDYVSPEVMDLINKQEAENNTQIRKEQEWFKAINNTGTITPVDPVQDYKDFLSATSPVSYSNGAGLLPSLKAGIEVYGLIEGGYGLYNLGKSIGNISVPLYRTFGGASRAAGEYWSPIVNTPKLFGKNYASAAGLPEFNSGAFLLKGSTPLKNLKLNTFKLSSPMGANKGGFLMEIRVIQQDAIKIKSVTTFEYANPTYNPNWFSKNYKNSSGQWINILNQ